MRFSISAAVLAFASAAFAQTANFDALTTPTKDEQVPAGQTYTINWDATSYQSSTVSLSLLGGATPGTLQVLSTLAAGVANSGSYAWTVDSSLGDLATYGIKISLDSDTSIFQYSFPFHITASSSQSSSVSAAGYPTAAATTSSSSSSSAAVETYSASAPVTATETTASSAAATTVSSSSFPSLTPSGTAGVSGYATGTGISTVTKSSSPSSTATIVTTNSAPRAAAGVTAVLIGALAAVFAF